MKLAAAAILSLVATATYASPVAYSENQVSAQYSAADESVTVHLEKRTGKRHGFMERIKEIQDSVNHDHHQQGHQQEQDSQQGQTHPRNDYQRLLQERQRQREEEQRLLQQRLKDQREEEQRLLQQRLQDQQRRDQEEQQRLQQEQQESEVEYHQRPKSPMEILQDWKEICLLNPNLYDYRNDKFICPEYIHDNKRPNLVEPPEEEHAQLGTTNKPTDARINSWEEMGDGKHEHKRPEHGQEFYQNREDDYRRLMKTAEGKKRHAEHIRRLEEKRDPNNLDPMLEYQVVIGAHLHDPLEPGPKIIKTESPEHLKSGLKKDIQALCMDAKWVLNQWLNWFEQSIHPGLRLYGDQQLRDRFQWWSGSTSANGKQPNNEAPPQSKVYTKDRRVGFQQLRDRFSGDGSTDANGKQPNNEDPPQSKVYTKDRRVGFQQLRDRFSGDGSTDASA
ncbi:hypothetical protein BASA50_008764 [Batrachochytrium salamandrivorans]|uniref:Uncharacterized protein n=1 Tax=Batrachochytrium salamandrivorans TaxID=1357716 RepID=A0ABQ8F6D4_9FUNG|nr:hypothetical protein BASA50_008764 [Batrachochytrium salamandrivorans]